jgi:hypothetical protein
MNRGASDHLLISDSGAGVPSPYYQYRIIILEDKLHGLLNYNPICVFVNHFITMINLQDYGMVLPLFGKYLEVSHLFSGLVLLLANIVTVIKREAD